MKRKLLILPAALLSIAAAVWAVDFAKVVPPEGELLISPRSETSEMFVLKNTGEVPLYYWGHSEGDASLSAKFADPSLKMPGLFICGTGMREFTLAAGESVKVFGFIPQNARIGEPVFVECHVTSAASGWDKLKAKLIDQFPYLDRHLTVNYSNGKRLVSAEFIPAPPKPELKTAGPTF